MVLFGRKSDFRVRDHFKISEKMNLVSYWNMLPLLLCSITWVFLNQFKKKLVLTNLSGTVYGLEPFSCSEFENKVCHLGPKVNHSRLSESLTKSMPGTMTAIMKA